MPKGDKYIGLKNYLQKSCHPMISLSFEQIEQIIGFILPKSASKFAESWWNNTEGSSQAISWLSAGYRTYFVTETYDGHTIVFMKE